ncbi:hypothetical protein [Cellulomonas biazotea]|uniref:Mrr-like domain-containing protein n=1 Tax=Cellulomonas biazotea TaxID=1709 RepID=A0A402DMR0_9CELL|nr:hypothetical protein [Cellulomonas biazotea]GCE75414.1 hypothetical protein CBZ_04700 [Cellulomonas biazotea]
MLPTANLLFQNFRLRCLTDGGAREMFQQFITDLVRLEFTFADTVAGPGGRDWGIDTFVGDLDGAVAVWQSKFFMNGVGSSQQSEIRGSFAQILKKAEEHKIRLDAWTLCLPLDMTPEERHWFDGWKGRQSRAHGVAIDLWSGSVIRGKLLRPDAQDIQRSYFPATADGTLSFEPLAEAPDISRFDDALFVRQLREAGKVETDAARGLFFAADALVRDITARENVDASSAIAELHLQVHELWERHYNDAVPHATASGQMAGLVERVVEAAGNAPDPEGLRLRPAHRRGIAHRLVEDSRAGWVTHWRDVAAEHGKSQETLRADATVETK